MKMKKNNFVGKKGAEKTISVYWFAILIIVAGAVIYMVAVVYGQPYDIRKVEAEMLSNNLADCISEGGFIKEKTFLDPSFKANFLEKCRINLNTEFGNNNAGQYYFEMEISDFGSGKKIDSISGGNGGLRQYCDLNGKNIPQCFKKSLYAIDKNQRSYIINFLLAVDKTGKNVQ